MILYSACFFLQPTHLYESFLQTPAITQLYFLDPPLITSLSISLECSCCSSTLRFPEMHPQFCLVASHPPLYGPVKHTHGTVHDVLSSTTTTILCTGDGHYERMMGLHSRLYADEFHSKNQLGPYFKIWYRTSNSNVSSLKPMFGRFLFFG